MNPDYNKIFTQSSCLTHNEMIEYVSGNLSADDKRRIEIHISDCDMCNDELEGLSNMKNVNDLALIVTSVNSEIDSIIERDKFKIAAAGSKKFNLKKIFSVAASVAILITIGFIINDFAGKNSDNLAQAEAPEESFIEEEIFDELKTVELEKSINENTERVNLSEESIKVTEDRSIFTEQIALSDIVETETDKDESTQFDEAEEIIIDDVEADKITPTIEDNTNRKNKLSSVDSGISDVTDDESTEEASKNVFGYTSRNVSMKKSEVSPSAGINYVSMRNSGLLSYNIKSYKEAAIEFDKYLKYKPEDYEIIYKSGMSYYFQKKYTSAISRYNKIIKGDINKYIEDAQWYKSIALINIGKEKEALTLLNQIVFKNGKYQKRALDAINQLENK